MKKPGKGWRFSVTLVASSGARGWSHYNFCVQATAGWHLERVFVRCRLLQNNHCEDNQAFVACKKLYTRLRLYVATGTLPPPHKQTVEFLERELVPRRAAVVAGAGALGGFHFSE